jgi:hypothetical protein
MPGAETPIRWPDKKRGPWELRITWEDVEGRWEPVGTQISRIDGAPITAEGLRSLRWGSITDQARPGPMRTGVSYVEEGERVSVWGPMIGWDQSRRGRPPLYGPEHYAEVARVYRAAFAENRTPTRIVARHFKVTPTTAAKWVARCRELGLLPPTSRGKARIHSEKKNRRKR